MYLCSPYEVHGSWKYTKPPIQIIECKGKKSYKEQLSPPLTLLTFPSKEQSQLNTLSAAHSKCRRYIKTYPLRNCSKQSSLRQVKRQSRFSRDSPHSHQLCPVSQNWQHNFPFQTPLREAFWGHCTNPYSTSVPPAGHASPDRFSQAAPSFCGDRCGRSWTLSFQVWCVSVLLTFSTERKALTRHSYLPRELVNTPS